MTEGARGGGTIAGMIDYSIGAQDGESRTKFIIRDILGVRRRGDVQRYLCNYYKGVFKVQRHEQKKTKKIN